MDSFIAHLGEEVKDADEETFYLFSHSDSSQDLGMIDSKAEILELSLNGRNFTIKQSPGVLHSNRKGGTTGAAVWRVSVLLAAWFGNSRNILFESGVLNSQSVVLELGSGISGLVSLTLQKRVHRLVATDQKYALKLLEENIKNNEMQTKNQLSGFEKGKHHDKTSHVGVFALDWELDDVSSFLHIHNLEQDLDAVIVCDCVFNYALITPLVETCQSVCQARENQRANGGRETIKNHTWCIVAQQLRQPDVFEQWLQTFMRYFRVWRVPDAFLSDDMKEGSGFVIHVAIIR